MAFSPNRTAVLLAALIGAAGNAASAAERAEFRLGGELRSYLIHRPAAPAQGPLPLVLSLHGAGSNAAEQEALSGLSARAEEEGFIAVYPEGIDGLWRPFGASDRDTRALLAILDALDAAGETRKGAVLANGISNGGQMAWRLTCEAPRRIALLGIIAASVPEICASGERPPVILFHGTADRLFPYGGSRALMGPRAFARAWAAAPACRLAAKGEVIFAAGEVTGERWSCGGRSTSTLYSIEGKGHSWPGSSMPARITTKDIDASAVLLAAFQAEIGP